MLVESAPRRIGTQKHDWTGNRCGCAEPNFVMVRDARSERLVRLLDASDKVNRGSERCLNPSVGDLGRRDRRREKQ
jgi:hypothetical protein